MLTREGDEFCPKENMNGEEMRDLKLHLQGSLEKARRERWVEEGKTRKKGMKKREMRIVFYKSRDCCFHIFGTFRSKLLYSSDVPRLSRIKGMFCIFGRSEESSFLVRTFRGSQTASAPSNDLEDDFHTSEEFHFEWSGTLIRIVRDRQDSKRNLDLNFYFWALQRYSFDQGNLPKPLMARW